MIHGSAAFRCPYLGNNGSDRRNNRRQGDDLHRDLLQVSVFSLPVRVRIGSVFRVHPRPHVQDGCRFVVGETALPGIVFQKLTGFNERERERDYLLMMKYV